MCSPDTLVVTSEAAFQYRGNPGPLRGHREEICISNQARGLSITCGLPSAASNHARVGECVDALQGEVTRLRGHVRQDNPSVSRHFSTAVGSEPFTSDVGSGHSTSVIQDRPLKPADTRVSTAAEWLSKRGRLIWSLAGAPRCGNESRLRRPLPTLRDQGGWSNDSMLILGPEAVNQRRVTFRRASVREGQRNFVQRAIGCGGIPEPAPNGHSAGIPIRSMHPFHTR